MRSSSGSSIFDIGVPRRACLTMSGHTSKPCLTCFQTSIGLFLVAGSEVEVAADAAARVPASACPAGALAASSGTSTQTWSPSSFTAYLC